MSLRHPVRLVWHTATLYDTPRNTATHCNALQHTATHCNTLEHLEVVWQLIQATSRATHCNARQRTAAHCNTTTQSVNLQDHSYYNTKLNFPGVERLGIFQEHHFPRLLNTQLSAVCSTLQRTTTHCNSIVELSDQTLSLVSVTCSVFLVYALDSKSAFVEWQCIEESMTCGSVVHREGVYVIFLVCRRLEMCVSCCSVLQCVVAVYSEVLSCVFRARYAYFDSLLAVLLRRILKEERVQRVAVCCCSVLQYVAVCCSVMQCDAVCCKVFIYIYRYIYIQHTCICIYIHIYIYIYTKYT